MAGREEKLLQIRDIDEREVRSVGLFLCLNREGFRHIQSEISTRARKDSCDRMTAGNAILLEHTTTAGLDCQIDSIDIVIQLTH